MASSTHDARHRSIHTQPTTHHEHKCTDTKIASTRKVFMPRRIRACLHMFQGSQHRTNRIIHNEMTNKYKIPEFLWEDSASQWFVASIYDKPHIADAEVMLSCQSVR